MKISVVIPVRNMASTLGDQLEALAQQSYQGPAEVVVVDNASTDETVAIARHWRGRLRQLRVVDAPERASSGYARNVGAEAAAGDALAYCDGDDVVGPRWLEAVADALERHDLVTGPLDYRRLNPPGVADLMGDAGWGRAPVAYRFLPYAMGSNLGVRRSLFETMRGFREDFSTGNDLDFCWRAQLSGAELHFAPVAVVHRRLPSGLLAMTRRQVRYASAAPKLFRDYQRHGMPASSVVRAVGDWLVLGLRSPELVVPDRRGKWCMQAGHRAGRLAGSVRSGVLFL